MAKKRTKKQKIKAQQRRQVAIGDHGAYSFTGVSEPAPVRKTVTSSSQTITRPSNVQDHSYVFGETKQTVLVTVGIIVAQLILAALIRTNVINLPF